MKANLGQHFPALRALKIFAYYFYDALQYIRHSNSIATNSTKNRMAANLVYQYHVVEKGLSMPNRRWNFGHPKIRQLTKDCNVFIDRFGTESNELKSAIGVLITYLDEHIANNTPPPADIASAISSLASRAPDAVRLCQKKSTRDEFFSNHDAPFPIF